MNYKHNFDPTIWGTKAWFFIDTICLSYPDNPTSTHKKIFKNFFKYLSLILPCDICSHHFAKYLKKYPLNNNILSSKQKLIEWILNAHNNIKKNNNQTELTMNNFYNYYNTQYNNDVKQNKCSSKCIKKPNNIFSTILYGIIISITLYILLNLFIS